jgi:hypothetical protein
LPLSRRRRRVVLVATIATSQRLSAPLRIVNVYQPDNPIGTPLSVTPTPGAPTPAILTVVLSENPPSVRLDALDSTDGYYNPSGRTIAGTLYDSALARRALSRGHGYGFAMSCKAATLAAKVGISDSADPHSSASVTVVRDGVDAETIELAYGSLARLSIGVRDIINLELLASSDQDSVPLSSVDGVISGDPHTTADPKVARR